jgi:protein-disulfide isomerase
MRKLLIGVCVVLLCVIAAFAWVKLKGQGAPNDAAAPAAAAQPAASPQPGATATATTSATTTAPAPSTTAATATTTASQTVAQPAASVTPPAGSQMADASGPLLYPDDMMLGSPAAKLTVIEYASLSCPHCAKFNTEVLPRLKTEYIDTGKVRWVYRDYPLNNPAYLAAVLAHCGSPLRFFGLIDTLFRSQDNWVVQPHPIDSLRQIGAQQGIDQKAYDACLADSKLKDKIVSRMQDADQRYKLEATPTFVVDGKVHEGELSYDEFKKLIDAALGSS